MARRSAAIRPGRGGRAAHSSVCSQVKPADERGLGGAGDSATGNCRGSQLRRRRTPRAGAPAVPGQVPAAQVPEHAGRPGGEARQRVRRACGQHPGEPGRRPGRQPPPPPPARLAGRREDQSEHEGQLGEQQVRDEDRHGARRDQLTAARQSRGNQVTGTPRHRSRPGHHPSHHDSRLPRMYPPCRYLANAPWSNESSAAA